MNMIVFESAWFKTLDEVLMLDTVVLMGISAAAVPGLDANIGRLAARHGPQSKHGIIRKFNADSFSLRIHKANASR